MSNSSFPSGSGLPSKPDPVRGEPWPPRAPGPDRLERVKFPQEGSTSELLINPPEGEGPVFAQHKHSIRREFWIAATLFVVYSVAAVLLVLTRNQMHQLWWLLIVAVLASAYVPLRWPVSSCSAGAEWLQRERGQADWIRPKQGTWVRTYELVSITVKRGYFLHLARFEDNSGRFVELSIQDLFANPDLWDLVYNGILHSVVRGRARTNKFARSFLELPDPKKLN